ncbi:hypothetical protein EJ04DRAFT_565195 [Polyplosphaeria fusca]|uniref:Uncharacterized protein n=1 Tax=Polyplosphaeria fusca TaxID=682080 RepID=A0A9P4V0A8_9PLEO|nr:hypothetical protein EJ04DRAFT_565195 [Polyplosphaeria fusca]
MSSTRLVICVRQTIYRQAQYKVNDVVQEIDITPISPAKGPQSYEGVYDRPAPGEDTLSVMYEPHRYTVRVPESEFPVNEEQSISMQVYDQYEGYVKINEGELLKDWQLEAMPLEEEHDEALGPSVPLETERIVKACVVTPADKSWVSGIILETSAGNKYEIPKGSGSEAGYESIMPDGFVGIRGFWGREDKSIDRLGVAWSQ